ncbi:MAG: TldD/PmbA family protein [Bacteroidales bacterium]|jgi:predicted Zn-dependent protease|nr:TldD/PmbA family protein [Bacteroidales bacterium]
MKTPRALRFLCFIFLLFSLSIVGLAQSQTDPLLDILQTELDRNMAVFGHNTKPVYLLSYRVDDLTDHNIRAIFGDLQSSTTNRQRILTIQVRVGSYELDNFHELRDDMSRYFSIRRSIFLPITDDNKAIAQILWRETDLAYKEAIARLEKVKANVAVKVESEDKAPDYSEAEINTYFEQPFEDHEFNISEWENRLRRHSALFANEKEITEGEAFLRYRIERKYFVTSEGTSIVQNQTYAHLYISGETVADDGMDLPLNLIYFAHTPAGIESESVVTDETREMIKTLLKLRTAPVVDSYTGPALLSSEAAGVFFHEIFGHRVEGQRMKSESDGQTFKKKLGEQVLDPSLSVIFDPTISMYKGIPLNGSYKFDDEGIEGKRMSVVNNGYLRSFLMTRTPIDSLPESNGHARAQAGYQPVSRQSNLIVETSKPHSDEQLRQMLVDEAIKQGKEYGYLFEKVMGGFTMTGRYFPNSFNVTPVEVYRIYVDGRPDELVRGVDLVGTPLSMFSQIGGAGEKPGNFAGMCGAESGGIPAGCCSPALFVKQIEMQKKSKSQTRPPIVERYVGDSISFYDFEMMIYAAMKDEIDCNLEKLKLEGLQSPYFISYLVSDARMLSAKSSLGGLIHSQEKPYRSCETQVLVGNHNLNNLNFVDENSLFSYGSGSSTLPIDNRYNSTRNQLGFSVDAKYKQAAEKIETKKAAIQQQNIPENLLSLPDYVEIDVEKIDLNLSKENLYLSQLEDLSTNLSKILEKYIHFTNSGVEVYAYQSNAYYLSSEGMKYNQPFTLIGLRVYAETIAEDGESLMNYFNLYAKRLDEFPDMDELTRMTVEMADMLETVRKAPVIDESYSGPVMFIGSAVGEIVANVFIENSNGLIAKRKPIVSNPASLSRYGNISGENTMENMLGKKVISRDLTITLHDRMSSFHNIPLIGYYQYDADGIKPSNNMTLVEQGVLREMMKDRVPTPKFAYPSGHNRLALSVGALTTSVAPGVMELSSKTKISLDKLKKKLITMAKEEDYEYAYMVMQLSSPTSSVPGMSKYQTKEGYYHPIYVIRINVKDGSETVMRTAKVSSLNMKSFKQVVAVSNQQQVCNTLSYGGNKSLYGAQNYALYGVPVSLIVPTAILFTELEVEKDQNTVLQKKPEVANPLND